MGSTSIWKLKSSTRSLPDAAAQRWQWYDNFNFKKNAGRKLMCDRHVVDDSFQGMLIFTYSYIFNIHKLQVTWKLHNHTLSTCSTSSQWTPSCSTAMDTSRWYDATTDELRNLEESVALTRSSAVVSHACGGKFWTLETKLSKAKGICQNSLCHVQQWNHDGKYDETNNTTRKHRFWRWPCDWSSSECPMRKVAGWKHPKHRRSTGREERPTRLVN